jgi:tetratricopeptide (TPR) repeat protein
MDPNKLGWELIRRPERTEEQLRTALSLFEEALKLRPDDGVPVANLCEALVALGKPEEAVARAEEESRSEHRTRAAAALNWLGWFWKAKPDTNEQAIERLNKAISLRSQWALPHANLGHALEAAGRSAEAYEQHGLALATQDSFDRAFSYERRGAFETRQGWLRNAITSFRAALETEERNQGGRVKTYQETVDWLHKALTTAGVDVPPGEFEERDPRWQREREYEIPPGFQARNEYGEPLAEETLEVERLIRAQRWDDAVNQLEKLKTIHDNKFFDAMGFAERGSRLARDAGAKEAGRKLLQLCLEGHQWYASGASSGSEGMGRMYDVDRISELLKKF